MPTLQVYDPAMCCSTGVCGPEVDPVLLQFAADLKWLASQGVTVERFNLGQEPQAFARQPAVPLVPYEPVGIPSLRRLSRGEELATI